MVSKPVSLPEMNLEFYIKNGKVSLSSSYEGTNSYGTKINESVSYEGVGTYEMGVYIARQVTMLAYTFQNGFSFSAENIQEFLPGMNVHQITHIDTAYSLPVGKATLKCKYRPDKLFDVTIKVENKEPSEYKGITPADVGKILSFEVYEKSVKDAPLYGVPFEDHGIDL